MGFAFFQGHVTSYYGPGLEKYTSFQMLNGQELRHLTTLDAGVLVLGKTALCCNSRQGIPLFNFR